MKYLARQPILNLARELGHRTAPRRPHSGCRL